MTILKDNPISARIEIVEIAGNPELVETLRESKKEGFFWKKE
ncbi:hypothetical protein [Methanosarcina sp. UBA5]|nr:hypothetical protein [Methanosarcina sp. UBA5]